jgi:hypothetical protein
MSLSVRRNKKRTFGMNLPILGLFCRKTVLLWQSQPISLTCANLATMLRVEEWMPPMGLGVGVSYPIPRVL